MFIMTNAPHLEEIKKRIVQAFDPFEIYLFGSYAWGHPSEESDLDLLIVVDQLKQKQWQAQSLGYEILFDLNIPKDIVVFPKHEFDQRSKNISSLFHKIKEKGVRIYARA
jgi:predicted nucleotidyltransferase